MKGTLCSGGLLAAAVSHAVPRPIETSKAEHSCDEFPDLFGRGEPGLVCVRVFEGGGDHPSPPCSFCPGLWQQPPSSEFTGAGGWGQISCGFGGLSRASLGCSVQPHEEGYRLMYKMAKELR